MSNLSAEEILMIAEEAEVKAGAFYRKAAGLPSNLRHRDYLRDLARMEDGHAKTFAALRKEWVKAGKAAVTSDPYGDLQLYINALVKGSSGEGSAEAEEELNAKSKLADILRIACEREKQSILLYLGLRDMAGTPADREKIDFIIGEERKHLATLSAKLKELEGNPL